MHWIEQFDLFLFDFDGLLVDTEELHLKAYKDICQSRGYTLHWNLHQFFEIAHQGPEGVKNAFKRLFPEWVKENWDQIYEEKKRIYENLLSENRIQLLPGAASVLEKLNSLDKRRCVVTHSIAKHVELIKDQIPLLQTIPYWFTRENYKNPKPAPDGYLTALHVLKQEGDRIIGFEDSYKGYRALQRAGVEHCVLICPPSHPQLEGLSLKESLQFYAPSFEDLEKVLQRATG
jgi:HAD superfamily hydrolase (TIGR01509 family)